MSGSAAVVFVKKSGYNENLCHWGGLDCLQLSGIDPNLMNIAFSLFLFFSFPDLHPIAGSEHLFFCVLLHPPTLYIHLYVIYKQNFDTML